MNKLKFLTLFSLFSYYIFSSESMVSWKANDMKDFIYKTDNVELIYLENIPSFYELQRRILNNDADLDLYISFDNLKKNDETGNYSVAYKKFRSSASKAVYNKSAYFLEDDDRVELERTKRSFFQPGMNLGSFSVSFWIFPVSFSSNETIIKIGSPYYNKKEDVVTDQSITGKIEDGKFNWEFKNIFTDGKKWKSLVKVESYARVIPGKWAMINLVFDSYKGIIHEYLDGNETGIVTATEDGTISSTVYNLRFDPTNRCSIKIGSGFEGAIDELYILKNSKTTSPDRYDKKGGIILSNVMEIDNDGAYIDKISFDEVKENNSDILYYYRYSDKPFHPGAINGQPEETNNPGAPQWKIAGNDNMASQKIKFLQWKIALLPGDNGEFSPKFKGITLSYNKDLPPSKPLGLKVLSGDHSVRIKWLPNSEKDIKGYKIYYGVKSGNYFSEDAAQGISPIDVGLKTEFEINGLNNDILYYFVVTAYDDNMKEHESLFSDETTARPLEKYKTK